MDESKPPSPPSSWLVTATSARPHRPPCCCDCCDCCTAPAATALLLLLPASSPLCVLRPCPSQRRRPRGTTAIVRRQANKLPSDSPAGHSIPGPHRDRCPPCIRTFTTPDDAAHSKASTARPRPPVLAQSPPCNHRATAALPPPLQPYPRLRTRTRAQPHTLPPRAGYPPRSTAPLPGAPRWSSTRALDPSGTRRAPVEPSRAPADAHAPPAASPGLRRPLRHPEIPCRLLCASPDRPTVTSSSAIRASRRLWYVVGAPASSHARLECSCDSRRGFPS